jgi:hypothetical protein
LRRYCRRSRSQGWQQNFVYLCQLCHSANMLEGRCRLLKTHCPTWHFKRHCFILLECEVRNMICLSEPFIVLLLYIMVINYAFIASVRCYSVLHVLCWAPCDIEFSYFVCVSCCHCID